MRRRNFIKALGGISAALAACGGATVSRKTPAVAVASNATGFSLGLDDAKRKLIRMLKDCRVVQIERMQCLDRHRSAKVTYKYAPGAQKTLLDEQAKEFTAAGHAPFSVSITQPFVRKAAYVIDVEWI